MNIWGKEPLSVLDRIVYAIKALQTEDMHPQAFRGIRDAISYFSGILYMGIETEQTQRIVEVMEKAASVDQIQTAFYAWYGEVRCDLGILMKDAYTVDRSFHNLLLLCERCSVDSILNYLIKQIEFQRDYDFETYQQIVAVYQKYAHFWGAFDPEKGVYDHFLSRIRSLKEHVDDVRWLYDNLADYRSKKVLCGILKFWITLDFNALERIRETGYDDYFDLDLLEDCFTEEEIFVDCGLFTGDTVESYFSNFSVYQKMYLYEMVPQNINTAREKLAKYGDLIFRNVGVGSKEQAGRMIKVKNIVSSAAAINGEEQTIVPDVTGITEEVDIPLVALDEDIQEAITFLKMDIEGAEMDALKGTERHIREEKPKLAICTYHHYSDLWEIPKLIASYRTDYRFYLRYHGGNLMATEHYLMAL